MRVLRLSLCFVAAFAAMAPAVAESLASSASTTASSAGSSASNSLEASSGSSSKRTATAAAGDYRIDAVTVAADRPGMVRLALQPAADERQPFVKDERRPFVKDERRPFVKDERQPFVKDERQPFVLVLPQRTAEQQGLARGDAVSVRERAYGFEFARADTRQAFFLVLADDWQRELDAHPLGTAARPL